MTCYYVCRISSKEEDWNWEDDDEVENWDWDDDDEVKNWNIEETNLGIRLGFDEGYKGYWLTIEDSDYPAVQLEDYIFHNMRDTKGVSMTISELEWVLATYGVGIPYPLAQKLVEDGWNGGHAQFLKRHDNWEKLAQFQDFYNRVAFSTPRQWQPAAPLPTSWEVLSARE